MNKTKNVPKMFKKGFFEIKYSEAKEQRELFHWAHYINDLKWMFAIPNGGYRNPKEALMLKLQGVRAGVSDIFIPVPNNKYHGFFLEMKVGNNKLSAKQEEFINDMRRNGYYCAVCYSHQEAITEINKYLGGKNE